MAGFEADITQPDDLAALKDEVLRRFKRIDILVNNAANNPKMESDSGVSFSRLENFPLEIWNADLQVGLTGAFLCSKNLRRGDGA